MQFSIDDHFVRFGPTRYAINKITSFRIETRKAKIQGDNNRFTLSLLGVIAGIFGILLLGNQSGQMIMLGLGLTGFSVWAIWTARKMDAGRTTQGWVFRLHIMTAAGEQVAFETGSKAEMDEIEAVLERAMQNAR